jgi:zinc/manganese transport system substrate-binding protein
MKFLFPAFALLLAALPVEAQQLRIVAAENFYGSVAQEIAGGSAEVTSILSNPNQDPHEFSTDAATARAVADADIIICNGLGYDAWIGKLLGPTGKPGRTVICVSDLIHAKNGENPHIWYDPRTMPALADWLGKELTRRLGEDKDVFAGSANKFKSSLDPVNQRIAAINSGYPGTTVTATEPVFGYMASALGFKMLNEEFQVAVMNDAEPGAAQTAAFQKSLSPKTVKILFYNRQVSDPTTERLKKIALQSGVPVVGVTETMPASCKTYAEWMTRTLDAVERALKDGAGFKDDQF